MKVYRAIPFIGGNLPHPMGCVHRFGKPFQAHPRVKQLQVKCLLCCNRFSIVEDERGKPASWWREASERWRAANPGEPTSSVEVYPSPPTLEVSE